MLLKDEKFANKLIDDMHVEVTETTLSGAIERYTFRNASIPKNQFMTQKSNQEYTYTDWMTAGDPKTGDEGSGPFCLA
jgi:hypothetical protein